MNIYRYLAPILIIMFSVSACGTPSESQSATDAASEPATGGESEPATGGDSSAVVIAAGGGDYRDLQEELFVPEMTQCQDGIVWDFTEDEAKMTKARTEAGGTGSLDVIELPDSRLQELAQDDVLLELDYSRMPNAANIREGLEAPYWVPHIYSASVLIFNAEEVSPAPDSYEVLWDPAYAGRIGVLSSQWSNFYYAAAALESNGEDNSNWDAGWARLQELKDSIRVYGSQEQLGQAMMAGEVWLTVNWKPRALQWSELGDVELQTVVPQEGTFPIVFGAGIAANAPNQECAYEFLNAMLSPEAQSKFSEGLPYSPTVDNAELPADLATAVDFSDDEKSRIQPLDMAHIVENDARWGQQWQQELIGG